MYNYNYCKKIHNYIKKFPPHKYKKKFALFNIRMINLSFDELRLIAEIRNINDYENKSKEDLMKALSETKPKPKPEPKPQTPKPETKPQTPKSEIRVNKRKFKKLREI